MLPLPLNKNKPSGFTLIELMVVMAIIAILATAGVSAYMNYIDKARVTKVGEFARGVDTSLVDKLVLRLDFDNNFLDTSGYNHHGTCTTNCPSATVGHNGGGAYLFDGVDDTLTLGIGSDFFPMPTFTLCSWIKTPGYATGMSNNGILSVTYGLTLFLSSTGKLRSYFNIDGIQQYATGTSNLHDNRFHHVCVAYDGTQRHLYIDGLNEYSGLTDWAGTTPWPNADIFIGTEMNNRNVSRFNGIIDDVRFYSGSLLAGDIEKMYRESVFKYLAQR